MLKRWSAAAAVGALAVGLTPVVAGAGTDGAGTGLVTIVHDATFDFPDAPFEVTVCVDDEVVDDAFEVTDVIGPVPLEAGTYAVEVFAGSQATCEGEPDIAGELGVAPGADLTAGATWTSAGPSLAVWSNDTRCAEEGTARVTVRHGADTDGPVDIVGIVSGGPVPLVEGLAEGAQATVPSVPGGTTVSDVEIVGEGLPEPVVVGDLTFEAGTHHVIYAAGGADGDVGVWTDPIPLDTCEVPVTPTSAPPTTSAGTAAPRAAAPAGSSPRFTG